MENEKFALITLIIAAIGTLAGLLTHFVKVKQLKEDQPRLKCVAEFSLEDCEDKIKIDAEIIIRSIGRRPVTIDSVRYYLIPHTFLHRIAKYYLWRRRRYSESHELPPLMTVTEGTKKTIPINLTEGLKFTNIGKVQVIDQTGRVWPVKWPRKSELLNLYQNETFHDKEYRQDDLICKLTGRIIGGSYDLQCLWSIASNPDGGFKRVSYALQNRKEFDKKMREITSNLTLEYNKMIMAFGRSSQRQ